ncbi:MAG: tetraacyldisaccharide 4'-kinase [Shewanella fodinae]|nr:tetraacyldisaccharide 4'-kinase [Shewanella fodinae]
MQQQGYSLSQTIVFADHHPYNVQDFAQVAQQPIVMTEKDAIKCRTFASKQWWYLAVDAVFSATFESQLLARVRAVTSNKHD